ncbi:nitrile hydratase accessory protein [Phreatobacter stygius]|uniref:Nitrile hydratase accessory protein n=1 Tax=Phreatobacter stygius TaxID=1940610 RepID=A0A4D7B6P0_9HYPH|nr:nitrile hydratase accessory protein [Phreatobacter stygius]QCI63832.1 nitrile hydratase accessory protein [Phreatobacter stygius]
MTISSTPGLSPQDISALPHIPCDAEGPVFREPWEAHAFALAVSLHGKGLFTWAQWAETLSAEIRRAQAAGDPDTGETYYVHWLKALETLVIARGVTTEGRIDEATEAWHRAAEATPHGQPIVLGSRTI